MKKKSAVPKAAKPVSSSPPENNVKQPCIIGIGASAGGLEALQELLSNFPLNLENVSVIVAQHLSPTYRSMLVQLLGRETSLAVKEAEHHQQLEGGCIYITPPDKDIIVIDNIIELSKPAHTTGPKPSVDTLFISLSRNKLSRVIGIILSGTGSDGAEGMKAIKESGGITIAQEPQTAKYNGMPIAAIESGAVDLVLSPDRMGLEIRDIIEAGDFSKPAGSIESVNEMRELFNILSEASGTDFSNYKPSTILRRIEKRMVALKIGSLRDYLGYLRQHAEESQELFRNILIGVTSFFRDKDAFEALDLIIRKIIAAKAGKESIRVWIPGCASGEEAYSIAILFAKNLKENRGNINIQIFATDIDERAVTVARKGQYQSDALQNLPQDLLDDYFNHKEDRYEVKKSIKSMILFSRHDLTNNPPFLKLDLISCRNLLIYFGNNLQRHIIPVFHYALNNNGYLFLGKSETVGQYTDLFYTADGKNKIFQRKIGSAFQNIKLSNFKATRVAFTPGKGKQQGIQESKSLHELVRDTIFSAFDHPYVVVSDTYEILEISGEVQPFLSFPQGTMNASLLKLIRKDLHMEVRSQLNKASKEKSIIRGKINQFEHNGIKSLLRITVKPIISIDITGPLIVIFESIDVNEFIVYKTDHEGEQEGGFPRVRELEQELMSTREHLQTYIEELETANEELQSLNEELQSTNEELQSSNEELETTNEELQATNEEIQVAYAELKSTHEELENKEKELARNRLNMSVLLNNTMQLYVLFDTRYNIVAFNEQCRKTFNIWSEKNVTEGASVIDFIPSGQLNLFVEQFQKALSGKAVEFETNLLSRDKKQIYYKVWVTPIIHQDKTQSISLCMSDITEEVQNKKELIASEKLIHTVFNTATFGILVTDANGYHISSNDRFSEITGYSLEELEGRHFTHILSVNDKLNSDFFIEKIRIEETISDTLWDVTHKSGRHLTVEVAGNTFIDDESQTRFVFSINDVTAQINDKKLIKDTHELAKLTSWVYYSSSDEFVCDDLHKIVPEFGVHERPSIQKLTHLLREGINRKTFEKSLNECIHARRSFDLELMLESEQVAHRWIRIVGKFEKMIEEEVVIRGFIQDIDNAKNIESDLKIFNKIFEQSPSAIIVTDTKGIIEYINPAFEHISGYLFEEAIGKNVAELKAIHDLRENPDDIWETILSGKNWYGTFINQRRNGEVYWVSASISPLQNESGEIINFISIQDDITEKIQLEEQLKKQEEQAQKLMTDSIIDAQEKERIEIGQELHDNINQMLASARVYVSALTGKDPFVMKIDQILMDCISEVRKLSHSLVLPNVAGYKLVSAIKEIINDLNESGSLKASCEFISFKESKIPDTMKLNIYRIIQIGVSNILKHAQAKNVTINLEMKDDMVLIKISDDGNGFDVNNSPTGIGLKNMLTRTSLHNGSLDIDSNPGHGTHVNALLYM